METLKGLKTVGELSMGYGLHFSQFSQWISQLKEGVKKIFGARHGKGQQQNWEEVETMLYTEIERFKMELDWLKKAPLKSTVIKRQWIDFQHPQLSVRRQCRTNRSVSIKSVLSAHSGKFQGSDADALTRRAISQHSVLWNTSNDGLSHTTQTPGQSQAGSVSDAVDGLRSCWHPTRRRATSSPNKVYPYLLRVVSAQPPSYI